MINPAFVLLAKTYNERDKLREQLLKQRVTIYAAAAWNLIREVDLLLHEVLP